MLTNEFAAFETLDLDPIKMKLMHVHSGEGWTALRADAVETEYRRFLFLMKKYPNAEASPTVDVDIFWHYHILDTLKYARDCEAVFGYFLHHYPYVGMGASANDDDHAAGGERMRSIYEAEFGTAAAANSAHAYCAGPGMPREAAIAAYAYCAGPGKLRQASDAAFAYCASPGTPREAANAAHAYCAAPGKPREAANAAAYAYCASPGQPREAANTAYAYCASPGQPREAANAAYAYCAAPGQPRQAARATYAYCASPGTPREAANAAYAYCASPGKPTQVQRDVAAGKELAHAA
ncbi:glycine-rich domain-containing protein-like [Massilia sp. IC2-476]|uniref:glycine-rich domain-containing protein n=1 Tax=Massilia sp. IC2-476 TaxID=2887199 RepID=UPI001D0FB092|nr:glycine-rich domain-containing protein-like [Massilia sp. IC2-476]MCC2971864.1 glycine-rich domain-containing protein-like [Massilia sp. IC2-476]